jgi:hypothetical protein
MLTTRWASRPRIDAFVAKLFAGLAQPDRVARTRMLHEDFVEEPRGLVTSGRSVLRDPRVLDLRAVGPVVTVEVRADWSSQKEGGRLALAGQRVRLMVHRSPDGLRALRLELIRGSDHGHLLASPQQGSHYRHEELGVAVTTPDGVVLERTHSELTDLQVLCIEPRTPDVRFQVLGHFALDEDTPGALRARLTGGAQVLLPAESVPTEHADMLVVGAAPFGDGSRSEGWLLGSSGRFRREQWLFAEYGRRCFLLKAVAFGASREEAMTRFREHAGWFAAMAANVEIE